MLFLPGNVNFYKRDNVFIISKSEIFGKMLKDSCEIIHVPRPIHWQDMGKRTGRVTFSDIEI